MTLEQLRKQIHVKDYDLYPEGIKISYVRWDVPLELGKQHELCLTPEETTFQLAAIGAIDSWNRTNVGIFITGDDVVYNWEEFVDSFDLSQWEALNLVIRHEYEKEVENETNLLEMDAAIAALKKI